jgi:CRP-like cAMP-binding protein
VNLILEGWACRYKTLSDGRRQILAILLPGDFCDMKVYLLKEMDHNIAAITPLRVAQVTREKVEALVQDHPRVSQALSKTDLVDLAIQREWTLNVGQRSAYERIGHLLLELFYRLRVLGMTDGQSFDFPLTQSDIAEATGLTTVHVNRTLKELRSDGLLEVERRRVTILNIERLEDATMFNPAYLHLESNG